MSEDKPREEARPEKGREKDIEDLFADEGTREFLKGLKRITKRNRRFVEGILELFTEGGEKERNAALEGNIKVVALDCDGVMLDSLSANTAYYDKILAHFGLPPVKEADIPKIHTLAARGAVAYLLRDRPELFEEAERFRLSMDYREFIPMLKKEPGLRRFLRFASERFKTAIATNRADSMNKVLDHLEIRDFFDLVVTARDVENPKPDADMLRAIVEHFKITPRELLFVGDSELDMRPAREIGCLFASFKAPDLDADINVESFDELGEALESAVTG